MRGKLGDGVFLALRLAALAIVAQLWAVGPAMADNETTFTLVYKADEATGAPGSRQGDMIISRATLSDPQTGEPRRRQDFFSVITQFNAQPGPGEYAQVRETQQTYTLADGILMSEGIILIPAAPTPAVGHYVIVGGTGAYANARGSVNPDTANTTYTFNVITP
jgi:hypothetical protein